MPWILPVAMLAAGIIKSEAVDRPKEKRERKLAAETQRYSPWTGLSAQPIKEADTVGSGMQYGATGVGLQQSIANSESRDKLTDAYTANLRRSGATPGGLNFGTQAGGGGGFMPGAKPYRGPWESDRWN